MNTEIQTANQLVANFVGFDASILAGSCSPSTVAIYNRNFAEYAQWAGFDRTAAMQASTLARWRAFMANETKLSPNTINHRLYAVKRMIKEAAAQGYCSSETAAEFDRISGVRVVALKTRQKAHARTLITPAKMKELCEKPNPKTLSGKMHRALLATLATSGLRITEALTLTPAQIEFGTDDDGRSGYYCLVMGKNESTPSKRPLGRDAHQLIKQWLSAREAAGIHSEFIFTGFDGRGARARTTPIAPASAWKLVVKYAKACGLEDVKPHDFRRFVGTRLAKEDIRLAQKALGHKNIATTAAHYILDDLSLGRTDSLY